MAYDIDSPSSQQGAALFVQSRCSRSFQDGREHSKAQRDRVLQFLEHQGGKWGLAVGIGIASTHPKMEALMRRNIWRSTMRIPALVHAEQLTSTLPDSMPRHVSITISMCVLAVCTRFLRLKMRNFS